MSFIAPTGQSNQAAAPTSLQDNLFNPATTNIKEIIREIGGDIGSSVTMTMSMRGHFYRSRQHEGTPSSALEVLQMFVNKLSFDVMHQINSGKAEVVSFAIVPVDLELHKQEMREVMVEISGVHPYRDLTLEHIKSDYPLRGK